MKECMEDKSLAESWHKYFYKHINGGRDLKYCGVPILKNPNDLHLIQEIIFEVKPEYIIETGTAFGGSALYYAHLLACYEGQLVITIDDASNSYVPLDYKRPIHPKLRYITGSSISLGVVAYITNLLRSKESRVLIILDSCHTANHVANELALYSSLVPPGSYLIVEDTNTDLVLEDYGPGPAQAVAAFLKKSKKFERDRKLEEKFGFSFNTYLKRI